MKFFLLLLAILFSHSAFGQKQNKDYSNILKSTNIYEIDAFLRDAHPDDPKRIVLKPRLINLINDYLRTASPEDQSVPLLQEKLAMLKRRPSTKISFEEMNANIRKKQIEYYQRKLAELEMNKYSHSNKDELVAKMEKSDKELKQLLSPEAYKATIEAARKDYAMNQANQIKDNATALPSSKTSSPIVNKTPVNISSPASSVAMTNTSSTLSSSEAEEFKMLMTESPEEHKRKTVGLLNKLFDNDPSSKDVIVMIENKSDCDMIMRIEGVGYTKYRLPIAARQENSIVLPKGSYLFSSLVCGAQYSSQKSLQKNIIVSLKNPN